MIQTEDVVDLVHSFDTKTDGEAGKSRELILALLGYSLQPLSRKTYHPGHITCTGAVIAPNGRAVLLVHHLRLDRWLLPGGHVEPSDASVVEVARREVIEETGAVLNGATPQLVNVDVHPIPPTMKEPLHLHHDLIFAFHAASEEVRVSEESHAVVWCPFDQFDKYELPVPIRRAVERAVSDIQAH